MLCPECKSYNLVKKGHHRDKQDYKCLDCGRRTVNPVMEIDDVELEYTGTNKDPVLTVAYAGSIDNTDGNILVIGDTHIPAERPGYLEFCQNIQKKWNCTEVVHIGDVADFHSISYHEHDPNAQSISDELEITQKKLKSWVAAFPNVKVCLGNHDLLVYRKAKTNGLLKNFFKSLNEILDIPETWEFKDFFDIQGIKFFHGTGLSGRYPHALAAMHNRQNCVMGHCHSVAGIEYTASNKDLIWGMAVGCGIDDRSIVMDYGRNMPRKSVIGCGVIVEGNPIIETMTL